MTAKKSHEEFIVKMAQVRPDIEVLGKYVKSNTKIKVKSSCGHIWEARPNGLLRGSGCLECCNKIKAASMAKGHQKFLTEIFEKHFDIEVLGLYQNAHTKIKVKHSCGYIWESRPNELLRGKGCPVCFIKERNARQTKDPKKFKEEMTLIAPDIEILGRYVNDFTKIGVKHSCGHIWEASPSNLLRGRGCPVCRIKQRASKTTKDPKKFKEEIAQIRPDIELLGEYVKNNIKIKVKHSCGYIWESTPATLLKGSSCPKCYGNQKKTHQEFIKQVNRRHPHNDIEVLGLYQNAHTKIKVKHSCGHIWETQPNHLLKNGGCLECSGKKNKGHQQFENEVAQKHPDIKILGQYVNLKTKISVKHSCGHIWEVLPSNLQKGQGCPECAKTGFHTSKPATFYLYEIIQDKEIYYGFGISNIYETREKRHIKNLIEAGANITQKWIYHFESGYDCKGLEDDIKAALSGARLNHNLGIEGFVTECAKEQARSLIMQHINKAVCQPMHATS